MIRLSGRRLITVSGEKASLRPQQVVPKTSHRTSGRRVAPELESKPKSTGSKRSRFELSGKGLATTIEHADRYHWQGKGGNPSTEEDAEVKRGHLDGHAFEAPKQDRRQQIVDRIEREGFSSVEVSEGGEVDLDLGGMPEHLYHNRHESMVIPEESTMHSSMFARNEMASRRLTNSWETVSAKKGLDPKLEREMRRRASDAQFAKDDSIYAEDFDDPTLEPTQQLHQATKSIYTQRKMYIDGLDGYLRIVTKEEERAIAGEVMQLLQRPTTKFIPDELRYCVNLFESELSAPRDDPLAYSFDEAPVLVNVLQRFVNVGIVPSMPNTIQISEMTGPGAGYPPHLKHSGIGPYFGLLNLVSSDVLHLRHTSQPWGPRLLMQPRSLYVVQGTAMRDYSIGYDKVHHPLMELNGGYRNSKDYRIEILFATTHSTEMPNLGDAVQMSQYAASQKLKQIASGKKEQESSGPVPAGVDPSVAGAPRPSYSVAHLLEELGEADAGGSKSTAVSGSVTRRPAIDAEMLKERLGVDDAAVESSGAVDPKLLAARKAARGQQDGSRLRFFKE